MNSSLSLARLRYFLFSAIFLACAVVSTGTGNYWILSVPFLLIAAYWAWQHLTGIFFILIALLPWSFEYHFNASFGTDLPDEPLMLLVAGIALCSLLLQPRLLTAFRHPLVFLSLAQLLWVLVTVVTSTDALLSLKFFLAKTWYAGAFVVAPLIVFRDQRDIRRTGLTLLISMSTVVLVILAHHAQLGFTFAAVNKAVSPFFRNHVNYSAMLVCILPLVVCVAYTSPKFRTLLFVLGGFLLLAAFFSYARGAWLAILTGTLAYWLIEKRKLVLAFVICIVASGALSGWLAGKGRYLQYANHYQATIFHSDFKQHLIATYRLRDLSTAERFNRWVAAARMIPDAGLSGFGPNTFYPLYKRYQSPAFRTWVSNNPEHSTVHNYFLMVLVEQGVIGLIIWLILCTCLLYYSQRLYHRLQDPFLRRLAAACGVMIVMIITVNFLSDLIETDKIGSLFLLCLSALVAIDSRSTVTTGSNAAPNV